MPININRAHKNTPKVNPPKTAIIRLASCNENTQFLFCSKIAGLSPFKRLVFSIQRAGIDNFIVFHENSPFVNNHEIEKDIKNDPRFKSNFQWKLLEKDGLKKNSTTDNLDPNVDKVLLVEGNLITTTRLIKDFIDSACSFETNEIVGLINESGFPDGIYLLTPSDVENYLDSESFEKKLIPARLPGPWLYRDRVENSRSLCLVEKKLLNEHKLHYRQFMDIWFSSLFSIPISSFLVKTFLTPNQVTVIGLFIGLASGFFFAQGNYLSGIIGGLLLVATAVWDCCDGDVARLKFMESDFGEKLDTACDNIINIFVFTGMMFGIAHSQGLIQATSSSTDVAINGQGFFVVSDDLANQPSGYTYSRNGNFRTDDQGFLINTEGYYLMGQRTDDTGAAQIFVLLDDGRFQAKLRRLDRGGVPARPGPDDD